MSRTPNRDKAMALMARFRPPVRPAGFRHGNTFMLNLEGPVLLAGAGPDGICAAAIIAGLRNNRDASFVQVDINSSGGSLCAAQEIYGALREHPGYKVINADKICASAASIIFLAGDFRTCSPKTQFLIHEPELSTDGERWTAQKHARVAVKIEAATASLVNLYAERTGRDRAHFEREIRNELRMDVTRAKKCGLVHCLAGEQRWINGRPYFSDGQSATLDRMISAMSPAELQDVVRKNLKLWGDTPYGHLAFATPARRR